MAAGSSALVALGLFAPIDAAAQTAPEPDAAVARWPRSAPPLPETSSPPWQRVAKIRRTHFELLAEVSPIGWAFSADDNRYSGLLRVGVGIWHREGPWQLAGFLSYQLTRLSYDTFSAHFLMFHKKGPGFHLGGLLDTSARPGFFAAFTFAAVGLELQSQWFDASSARPTVTCYLKLALPIFLLKDEFTYLERTQ